jgi:opacity protein-like surface antigen
MRRFCAAVMLLTTTAAGSALAQRRPYREPNLAPPVAFVGVGLQVGQAIGEFANYVDVGGGFGGSFLYTPTPDGVLGLRLSAMLLIYGSQTNRYPLVPGITVDVTTNNEIVGLTVGPQLTFGHGGLKAYVLGGVGFSYFATTSEVRGSGGNSPFASSTNYDDFTLATEGGAGLLVRISRMVNLDLGARYLNNGRVTYVTRNGVQVVGNTMQVNPIESEANLVVYHLGVMVGLRRPPPEPPRE